MTGSSGVPTFRAVVERALVEALRKEENPKRLASALAEELRSQFRAAGFSIHARGACARLHGPDAEHIGRPMTEAEAIAVGLELAGETLERASVTVPDDAPIG